MKGIGARRIRTKLSRVLGDDCYSPAAIEGWVARFREGDLSYADHHSRSSRRVIAILECLGGFLNKFPFTSANMISKQFRIVHGTITEILQRGLGFKKLSRRWMPHQLSSSQKVIVSIVLELYCTCCEIDSFQQPATRSIIHSGLFYP
jgi:hypothetical protein